MIHAFVLDASSTLACLLPDEQPDQFPRWVDHIATARIVVPPAWPIEVVNGFAMAVRRKRISQASATQLAEPLRVWPVTIEPPALDSALTRIWRVARDYGLSAYDAAYLEAAMRLRLPLVTLDRQLAVAAKSAKVALLA